MIPCPLVTVRRLLVISCFGMLSLVMRMGTAQAQGCHLTERPEVSLSYMANPGTLLLSSLSEQSRAERAERLSRSCPTETPSTSTHPSPFFGLQVSVLELPSLDDPSSQILPLDSPWHSRLSDAELSRPPRALLAR